MHNNRKMSKATATLSFLQFKKCGTDLIKLRYLSEAVDTIASKPDDTADAIQVLADTADAVKVLEDFAKVKADRADEACRQYLTRKRRNHPELEAKVVLTDAEAKEAAWFTEVTKANEDEIEKIKTVIDVKVSEAIEATKTAFKKYKTDLKAFNEAEEKVRAS